ncbi:MAG: cell division protein FtsZ [Thermonemataceae bacterium]|nr:cell division protein FtsZ [Thermonemataceae bacterium]
MSYTFVKQNLQGKSIIKVIGVGGGGSNAVNHMFNRGIKDVEFIVCNTDAQALNASPVPNKLQIGIGLTEGLGAGANPERGREAAIESKEDIRELLSSYTKMVFITAGMGGGTGTGAAPIIAQIARDLDILTVGIVTAPFDFEGKKKIEQANKGIEELRKYCDTVLVISNDKLREMFSGMPMSQAYAQADNVLTTAAKSIAELITVQSHVNVDFEDVKTVMRSSGTAVMGSAKAEGEQRALKAIEEALMSPLLNNKDIKGAKKILLSIMSSDKAELQMEEFALITDYITEKSGETADVIWGTGIDSTLGEAIRVTIIATGFSVEDGGIYPIDIVPTQTQQKKIIDIDTGKEIPQETELSMPFGKTQEEVTSKMTGEETSRENTYKEKEENFSENSIEVKEEKIVLKIEKIDTEEKQSTNSNKYIKKVEEKQEEDDQLTEMELKRLQIQKNRQDREKALKNLSTNYLNDNESDLKEKFNVPTYMRKNIQLKEDTHSSDKKLSKFSIDEDGHIIKNNKFFDEKPD